MNVEQLSYGAGILGIIGIFVPFISISGPDRIVEDGHYSLIDFLSVGRATTETMFIIILVGLGSGLLIFAAANNNKSATVVGFFVKLLGILFLVEQFAFTISHGWIPDFSPSIGSLVFAISTVLAFLAAAGAFLSGQSN